MLRGPARGERGGKGRSIMADNIVRVETTLILLQKGPRALLEWIKYPLFPELAVVDCHVT